MDRLCRISSVMSFLPPNHEISAETVEQVLQAAKYAILEEMGAEVEAVQLFDKVSEAWGDREMAKQCLSRLPEFCSTCGRKVKRDQVQITTYPSLLHCGVCETVFDLD